MLRDQAVYEIAKSLRNVADGGPLLSVEMELRKALVTIEYAMDAEKKGVEKPHRVTIREMFS